MVLTKEDLAAHRRFFKAHFDKVGRGGSYEPPPSDISSTDSDRPCTPSGLLTPSRETHGTARPTRVKKRQPRPVRPEPVEDTSVEQFRQWLAALPPSPPEFFPRLDTSNEYVFLTPGMEYDWDARSSRSKMRKEPYLFALNAAKEATIASLGDDSPPLERSQPANPTHPRKRAPSKLKPNGVTKSRDGRRRKSGSNGRDKRRIITS